MLEEIRNNREKDYANAALKGQEMQLGFLRHSLMISRMHFCVEMATSLGIPIAIDPRSPTRIEAESPRLFMRSVDRIPSEGSRKSQQ
jgi:hypothetical protein